MKIKALLVVVLFVVGLVASLAFAKSPKPSANALTTTTTTATKPKCDQVELKGNATVGSITFTVAKANKRGRNLVGKPVTLVIPAGAKVKAKACTAAGALLTLRELHVKASPAKP